VPGADTGLVREAAQLCKADLVTETVGEFPELQGQVGRELYALQSTGGAAIAQAIEDHYRPLGPSDRVPADPVSICVALADKLDTLAAFWAIGEKPTGSKDPYALRRAALGLVRIILDNGVRFSVPINLPKTSWLEELIVLWFYENVEGHDPSSDPPLVHRLSSRSEPLLNFRQERFLFDFDGLWSEVAPLVPKWDWENDNREPLLSDDERRRVDVALARLSQRAEEIDQLQSFQDQANRLFEKEIGPGWQVSAGYAAKLSALRNNALVREASKRVAQDLLAFLADRLKVQLREQGKRHDLVDAVFALGDDDLVRIAARVAALSAFLATDDGANLLAGYRRAANILKAEEKKDPAVAAAIARGEGPDRALMSHPAERGLLEAIVTVEPEAANAVAGERFEAAMAALARLRAPVDAFFEDVLVNDANPAVRKNRLLLLARARGAMNAIADFGRIEG